MIPGCLQRAKGPGARRKPTCCSLEVVALTAAKGVCSGSCESMVYRCPIKWQTRDRDRERKRKLKRATRINGLPKERREETKVSRWMRPRHKKGWSRMGDRKSRSRAVQAIEAVWRIAIWGPRPTARVAQPDSAGRATTAGRCDRVSRCSGQATRATWLEFHLHRCGAPQSTGSVNVVECPS